MFVLNLLTMKIHPVYPHIIVSLNPKNNRIAESKTQTVIFVAVLKLKTVEYWNKANCLVHGIGDLESEWSERIYFLPVFCVITE